MWPSHLYQCRTQQVVNVVLYESKSSHVCSRIPSRSGASHQDTAQFTMLRGTWNGHRLLSLSHAAYTREYPAQLTAEQHVCVGIGGKPPSTSSPFQSLSSSHIFWKLASSCRNVKPFSLVPLVMFPGLTLPACLPRSMEPGRGRNTTLHQLPDLCLV